MTFLSDFHWHDLEFLGKILVFLGFLGKINFQDLRMKSKKSKILATNEKKPENQDYPRLSKILARKPRRRALGRNAVSCLISWAKGGKNWSQRISRIIIRFRLCFTLKIGKMFEKATILTLVISDRYTFFFWKIFNGPQKYKEKFMQFFCSESFGEKLLFNIFRKLNWWNLHVYKITKSVCPILKNSVWKFSSVSHEFFEKSKLSGKFDRFSPNKSLRIQSEKEIQQIISLKQWKVEGSKKKRS